MVTLVFFLILGVRNVYVLQFDKIQPLFKQHNRFVLDFEYFYDMGKQSVTFPEQLYSDPKNEGTPVLLLHRNVFHPYPPPAALFFRIFSLFPFAYSYAVWSFFIYAIIIFAIILYVKCLDKDARDENSGMWFPFILCVSAAPSFLDSSFGNVNSLLLLLCVVYAWFFKCQKFILAGLVLSVAFWLKLYPALLLLTLFKAHKKVRLAGSFLVGVAVIFVLSLFFIPIDVFKEFFFEIAPAYSGQTITHVFNQSLIPALLRVIHSSDTYFSYDYMLIPPEIRIITSTIIGSVLIVFCLAAWKYEASSACMIAGLCNFIPLITPIGWGYTFVMLYPSLIFLYYHGILKSKIASLLYLFGWFALAIPSYHRIGQFMLPGLAQLVYYSRYTIADILLSGLLFQQMLGFRVKLNG
jgi:hypothetical protein